MSVTEAIGIRIPLDTVVDHILYALVSQNTVEVPEKVFRRLVYIVLIRLGNEGYNVENDFNSDMISASYLKVIDEYVTMEIIDIEPGTYILRINQKIFTDFYNSIYNARDRALGEKIRQIISKELANTSI